MSLRDDIASDVDQIARSLCDFSRSFPQLTAKFVLKSPHFTLDPMTLKVYDSTLLASTFVRKDKLDVNNVQKL